MIQRTSGLLIPVFVLSLSGCGAGPKEESTESKPDVGVIGTDFTGPVPDVATAKPLAVTELKHAGGAVFLSELGSGYVVAEQTNLDLARPVIETMKAEHASPLELFVTLTDAEPPRKLVEHHFATHRAGPAKVAGIARPGRPGLAPLLAPCAEGQNVCVLTGTACNTSTHAWVYLLATGGFAGNNVAAFEAGQGASPFFSLGRVDSYVSLCSETHTIDYGFFVRPAGTAQWFMSPMRTAPKSYFFLAHYGGLDATNDVDILISFTNPTKVAGLLAFKVL